MRNEPTELNGNSKHNERNEGRDGGVGGGEGAGANGVVWAAGS